MAGINTKIKIIFSSALVILAMAFLPSRVQASPITPEAVIGLANQERVKKNLPPLEVNARLSRAAADKAEDMIKNNYFEHTSPSGLTPWDFIQKNNYNYKYAGENLAMNFTTAEGENKAWMDSPAHRDNILNPHYQEIGVAVAQGIIGGHQTTIAVQEFGSRADFVPATPKAAKNRPAVRPAKQNAEMAGNPRILAENTLSGLSKYLNALDKFIQDNLGASASAAAMLVAVYCSVINFVVLAYLAAEARRKTRERKYHLLYTANFGAYLKS